MHPPPQSQMPEARGKTPMITAGRDNPRGICVLGLNYTDQLTLAGGDRLVGALRGAVLTMLRASFGADRVHEAPASGSFVVMLRGAPREVLAAQVRAALDRVPGCRLRTGDVHFSTTAHAGIIWTGALVTCLAELTRIAAAACAAAHARGVDLVEHDMRDTARLQADIQSARLLSDVVSAMDESRLILFAQEIVDTDPSSRTRDYEVLVKMQDRAGRIHAPSAFLPLVERTSMICTMDAWIIRKAILGHAEALVRRPDIHISLNLSGRTLSGRAFWRAVDAIVTEAGIDPARLQFEITETSAIHDLAHAKDNVRALRRMGCSVALDDFGAGLSGFSYLTDLDVNCVKIDGGLVANVIHPKRRELKIVSALVWLCTGLGLDVVGEHVSSAEIYDILTGLGVSKMQGFFVGAAVPYGDIFASDPQMGRVRTQTEGGQDGSVTGA